MIAPESSFPNDRLFYSHPSIVGGKIVVLAALSAGVVFAGLVYTTVIVAPVVCALLILAVRVAFQELTTTLVVRKDTLLVRRGWIIWREKQVPLHRAQVQTVQSVLGRLFDYGHLTIVFDDETLTVRNIGEFRALQVELARLQRISALWRVG